MRTNVIAGNWKMNKTNAEAVEMLTELKGLVKDVEGVKIVIGAPFTALSDAVKAVEGSNVEIAAENVYQVNYKTGKKQKTITVKSNKTLNKVLKSLKKKATYSVKVRSYKKVSGVTYYSEWSSAKKVKIKK